MEHKFETDHLKIQNLIFEGEEARDFLESNLIAVRVPVTAGHSPAQRTLSRQNPQGTCNWSQFENLIIRSEYIFDDFGQFPGKFVRSLTQGDSLA